MNKKIQGSSKNSVVLSLLARLLAFLHRHFDRSIFGFLTDSSDAVSDYFEESATGRFFLGQTRRNSIIKRLLRFVASGFENSFFAKLTKKGYALFLNLKLKSIGFFFATYSLFALFAWMILYFTKSPDATYSNLITVIGIGVVALPLVFSSHSLISGIGSSRVLSTAFNEELGIDTESKSNEVKNARFSGALSGFSLVFGIIAGTFSVFISPVIFASSIIGIITLMFVLTSPESGIIFIISSIPFYSIEGFGAYLVFGLIAATTVSYIGKLIRGKRIFTIGFLDIVVLVLFLIMFTSCFGHANSYNRAATLVGFMLVYFLFVNIIRNRTWLKRVVKAIVFSSVMIAFLGVMAAIWNNTPILSEIKQFDGQSGSFFIFGEAGSAVYLLLPAIPFLFSAVRSTKDSAKRSSYMFFAILVLVCIVFGGNSMPLGPMISGVMMYFLLSMPMMIFIAIPAFLVYMLIRGVNIPIISDFAARSAEYAAKISAENRYFRGGVSRALGDYILTGIGMGDETFSKVYPNYSYAGFEGAADSGSSLLDILLGFGIIGGLVFIFAVLVFMRESIGFIRQGKNVNKIDKLYVSSAFSSVFSIIAAAFTDNVFEVPTVFLYMWIMMAIGISYVRMDRLERKRAEIRHPDTPGNADAKIPYIPIVRQ